jgi:lysophospholipase
VRIRAGVWARPQKVTSKTKGTVFILPGRTEFVEKYGHSASELSRRGYSALAIDWRGQGIADRLLDNRAIGHVETFDDYQRDLEAVISLADRLELPKPYYMLAHSMGGAIGLRALFGDTPFKAAAFSAPMWGIGLTPIQKIMIRTVAPLLTKLGLHQGLAPGTKAKTYVLDHAFEDNLLTADPEMFEAMRTQVNEVPELALGGPSIHWVMEGIKESAYLAVQPAADTPIFCALGLNEAIVDASAVRNRIATWPNALLLEVPFARHELPIEVEKTRTLFFDRACELFASHP